MNRLKGLLSSVWSDLRARKIYWTTAFVVLLVTIWAEPFVDARLQLSDVRAYIFEHLFQSVTNPATTRDIRLVAIRDDEYWNGPLKHRVPTDRAYLAQIVRSLESVEASVIALDFDLRLPDPKSSIVPGEYSADDAYRGETDELIRTIGAVANNRKIVLAKTIGGPIDGPFKLLGDVYQAYGICTSLKADGAWENPGTTEFQLTDVARKNISCGYIALMPKKEMVPPPAKIEGTDSRLVPFSFAVARAWSHELVPNFGSQHYFASYISATANMDSGAVVSAHDLLTNAQATRDALQGHPVIVGAAWHSRSKGSGDLVDLHPSPIGRVSGAIIHQNLAEAMLSSRVFPGLSEHEVLGLDLVVGTAAAIFFGTFSAWWARLLAVAGAIGILFLIEWVTLQLFGTFLDAYVPVLGLGLHTLADRLIGERHATAVA